MRILTDPYYYGAIEYNGKLYAANIQHEPLVTRELFDAVQVMLRRKQKGRYRQHQFAFGGCIMRCGACGRPVTAERQKEHVYYHCTGIRKGCAQRTWTREETINEQLQRILLGLRLSEAYLAYAFAKLRKCHALEAEFSHALRLKLQGELNASQQKLDALLQLKIAPANRDGELLSDEEYLRQKRVLKDESDLTQRQLLSAQKQGETWMDDCEAFFRITQRLATQFHAASAEQKKDVLLLVCSNLTLTDQNVGAVYREPYAALADFPLAGDDPNFPTEPEKIAEACEKPEIVVKWLGILDTIRATRPWLSPVVSGMAA